MPMTLYHATTLDAARKIHASRCFRCGKRGYAGPAVYFASKAEDAVAHAFNGRPDKKADIVISCFVELGRKHVAKKHELTAQPNGFDSVRIKGQSTFAVYDPARITILDFQDVAGNQVNISFVKRSKSEKVKAMSEGCAVKVISEAITSSPGQCLNEACLGNLYSKHAGLRELVGGMKSFCARRPEFVWDGKAPANVSFAMSEKYAVSVIIRAIEYSPAKTVSAVDLASLYSTHACLRKIVGDLSTFCAKHPELAWDRSNHVNLSLAMSEDRAVQVIVEAIKSSAKQSLDAADLGVLYSTHEGLRTVVRGMKTFCKKRPELVWDGKNTLANASHAVSKDHAV